MFTEVYLSITVHHTREVVFPSRLSSEDIMPLYKDQMDTERSEPSDDDGHPSGAETESSFS